MQQPPKGKTKNFAATPLAFLFLAALVYLILHLLIPNDEGISTLWESPLQWLDWIFWSLFGILLRRSADLAKLVYSPQATIGNWHAMIRRYGGVLVALVLLFAIHQQEINVAEIELNLANTPVVGVALAFTFGYYPEVSEVLFFSIVAKMIRRTIEKILGRSLGDPTDDFEYIRLYVNPGLRNVYLKLIDIPEAKAGHIASRERRVGYQIVSFLHKEGFTVNALKAVYFGREVFSLSPEVLGELIAHEASHVKQNFYSDSIDQEVKAYITGARVRKGLQKSRLKSESEAWHKFGIVLCDVKGEFLSERDQDWEQMHEKAVSKVRSKKDQAALYGFIPVEQAEHGLADIKETMRQGGFLIKDFLIGNKEKP